MKIEQAKKALEQAGFKVSIDNETDGLNELSASKDGYSETFFDCNLSGHCSTYLCEFDTKERLVAYAEKSIKLAQKYA